MLIEQSVHFNNSNYAYYTAIRFGYLTWLFSFQCSREVLTPASDAWLPCLAESNDKNRKQNSKHVKTDLCVLSIEMV